MEHLIFRTQALFEMTDEQFFQLCADNKDLSLERNSNLDIIVKPPKRLEIGKISGEIVRQLANWNIQKGLGKVVNSSAGFILFDKSIWSPFAAWLSMEKFNKIPDEEKSKFPHVCPEFVIEIMSPSDNYVNSEKKMLDWIKNGCRLAWLICPEDELVKIYQNDKPMIEIQGFDKTVSNEDVLSGFVLDLSLIRKKR